MKRILAILSVICVLVLMLAGCGSRLSGSRLSGTYVPVDPDDAEFSSITFKGDKVSVDIWGLQLKSGTYTIHGDSITLNTRFLGQDVGEETMSFIQSGDSIFLDGEEYVLGKPEQISIPVDSVYETITEVSSGITTVSRAVIILSSLFKILIKVLPVAAIVVLVLLRKKIPWVDAAITKICSVVKKTGRIVVDTASQVSRKVSDPETMENIKERAAAAGKKMASAAADVSQKVSDATSAENIKECAATVGRKSAAAVSTVSQKVLDPGTMENIKERAASLGRKVSVTAGKAAATVGAGFATGKEAFREEMAKRQNANSWRCPSCGTANAPESRFCTNCGCGKPDQIRAAAEKAQTWRCPDCGTVNTPESRFCTSCGCKKNDSGVEKTSTCVISEFGEHSEECSPVPTMEAPTAEIGKEHSAGERHQVNGADCCICGAPLDDGAVKLLDHPCGIEMRVCKKCHKAMYLLATTKNPEQFESANKEMRRCMESTDPVVTANLERFLRKAEARFWSGMMDE